MKEILRETGEYSAFQLGNSNMNRQILSLRNEAFTSYDKGIAILSAIQEKKGSDFLTPELILDLLRKEYKERLYKIHEDLMELKKQGVVINIREPDADRFAVEAVLNDPKLQEIRYFLSQLN